MKRLLGKVSVYLDDTDTSESSHLAKEGNNEYTILLTPAVDKDELENRGIPYRGMQNTATALAHEFGHLIGEMLHSPAEKNHDLASESEAWHLAEIAYPNLDKQQRNAAMGTYR
jgi:hypothetical protein